MRLFKISLLITYFLCNIGYSQNYSANWKGYFSYLNIKDIAQKNNIIYAASENSIFKYDTTNKDIQKLETINGLSGETISAINYLDTEALLIIGFENGLVQIYEELTGEITTVVDIFNKKSIPPNSKRINHINIIDNKAYLSTNFGISVFDLNRIEFGDTYLIGPNGSQTKVNQTTIVNNFIYTATSTGIKKGDINNPNLTDFKEWEIVNSTNWIGIESVNNTIFAVNSNNELHEILDDNSTSLKISYTSAFKRIVSSDNKLAISLQNEAFLYNSDLTEVTSLKTSEELDTNFNTISFDNSNLYIGTIGNESIGKAGLGILKQSIGSNTELETISPDSPLSNKIFKISVLNNEIWESYGGYSGEYGWDGGVRKSGVSHYKNDEWTNIDYSYLENFAEKPWHLTSIAINPFNLSDVYISSYFSGLISIRDNEFQNIYNKENSALEPFAGDFYLTNVSTFDEDGTLWITNARVNNSLVKYKDGDWESINLINVIENAENNRGFSSISKNEDYIFLGTGGYGVIGYDINRNKLVKLEGKEQNLPDNTVTSVVIDKKKSTWIGTISGLRVIYNLDEFFNKPNYQASNIVILDDGIPKELLYQQAITDIVVDGSNNKWISTIGTGVFFLSEDGQETISHFTTDNSPLPTNDVLDLDFDESTGMVYMATQKGLVAYDSGSSNPKEQLDKAFVYPNPVRPNFDIASKKIKIKDLSSNVNIKITDVTGNLVAEGQSKINQKYKGYNLEVDGGTAFWNGNNLAGNPVASGVYSVFISDLDSDQTKTLKIMIIK